MRKSAKRTTPSRVLTAAQRRELATLAALPDDKIDYSDIPPLDKSFLKKATTAWPPVKKQLTIRVDADVLN